MYIPIGILVLLALVFLSFDDFLLLLTIFVFGWLLIYMWPLALILLILVELGLMFDKLYIIIERPAKKINEFLSHHNKLRKVLNFIANNFFILVAGIFVLFVWGMVLFDI